MFLLNCIFFPVALPRILYIYLRFDQCLKRRLEVIDSSFVQLWHALHQGTVLSGVILLRCDQCLLTLTDEMIWDKDSLIAIAQVHFGMKRSLSDF